MYIKETNYDASRQRDIAKMQAKLQDPTISEGERQKAAEVLRSLKDQAGFSSINRMRENLARAQANGDKAAIDRLTEQAQRIDRDWSGVQRTDTGNNTPVV